MGVWGGGDGEFEKRVFCSFICCSPPLGNNVNPSGLSLGMGWDLNRRISLVQKFCAPKFPMKRHVTCWATTAIGKGRRRRPEKLSLALHLLASSKLFYQPYGSAKWIVLTNKRVMMNARKGDNCPIDVFLQALKHPSAVAQCQT